MNKKIAGLDFIHKDAYGIALEVAKRFVNKSDTRPLIKFVNHTANGDMIATDSHRLIHIREMHGFEKDYLVNPHNFMIATGNYPDTEKLAEINENCKEMIVLNKEQIKLWLQLFKSINQTLKVLKDYNKLVKLTFTESETDIDIELNKHGIKMSLPCTRNMNEKHDPISFNAEYMRDALEAHFKLNSEQLRIWFASPFRPFIMDDDNQVRTLILPLRTYD